MTQLYTRLRNGLFDSLDTAGEVRGSLKTAQIRAVFRAFSTLINCESDFASSITLDASNLLDRQSQHPACRSAPIHASASRLTQALLTPVARKMRRSTLSRERESQDRVHITTATLPCPYCLAGQMQHPFRHVRTAETAPKSGTVAAVKACYELCLTAFKGSVSSSPSRIPSVFVAAFGGSGGHRTPRIRSIGGRTTRYGKFIARSSGRLRHEVVSGLSDHFRSDGDDYNDEQEHRNNTASDTHSTPPLPGSLSIAESIRHIVRVGPEET